MEVWVQNLARQLLSVPQSWIESSFILDAVQGNVESTGFRESPAAWEESETGGGGGQNILRW